MGVRLSSDIQSRWQGHRTLTGIKCTIGAFAHSGQESKRPVFKSLLSDLIAKGVWASHLIFPWCGFFYP